MNEAILIIISYIDNKAFKFTECFHTDFLSANLSSPVNEAWQVLTLLLSNKFRIRQDM